jgi:hypothetical protein
MAVNRLAGLLGWGETEEHDYGDILQIICYIKIMPIKLMPFNNFKIVTINLLLKTFDNKIIVIYL